jgi:hypothetical protein
MQRSTQPGDQQQFACLVPRSTTEPAPGPSSCRPGGWQLQRSKWHLCPAVTMMPP